MNKVLTSFAAVLLSAAAVSAQEPYGSRGGATQQTPSRSEYFSWINNTNEGAAEAQTLTNLEFFKWLHDSYGMQLNIYAFDAGALDGSNRYGHYKSDLFLSQFPRGFRPITDAAAGMNTAMGLWGGPDGFGDSPEDARKRMDMMVDLVQDYNFRLFKFDGVCGPLRPSKYDYFDEMMTRIRDIAPDFILLNHRLDFGPKGNRHPTTYLLGGDETYVDVHMWNKVTAPHHRAGNLARENTPDLTRLSEDHGVCISSCLDAWDDDLVLQAFCRNLIVSPQIYGNPWLLRDDEMSYLAYLFNLHSDYRDILPDGKELPEAQYGEYSVSRGDSGTRFITIRNLSWETREFTIDLDAGIGLEDNGKKVKARLYHPYIEDLGNHKFGEKVTIPVEPYRVALIKLTNVPEKDNLLISGIPYRIVNDRVGDVREVKLLYEPGHEYDIRLTKGAGSFKSALIGEVQKKALLSGKTVHLKFDGARMKDDADRLIAEMTECPIPEDMEALYYATAYAADNDALEVRSLRRSGPTAIPQVQAARDAFFGQEMYVKREVDSRNLFDGDLSTAFSKSLRGPDLFPKQASFLLDLGSSMELDSLTFDSFDWYSLQPLRPVEGAFFFYSDDLAHWEWGSAFVDTHMTVDCTKMGKFRYFRLEYSPLRLCEVTGYKDGEKVCREQWRASNLFHIYGRQFCTPQKAWSAKFKLDEIPANSYLCVAINGKCGKEGAFAAFRVNGKPVGCPDRAPSYWSNVWEWVDKITDSNYTYYLPLTEDMKGAEIDAVALKVMTDDGTDNLDVKVYISTYPYHQSEMPLVLKK